MKKELSISDIFTKDALEIVNKRKDSFMIHSKNIRAAGDEVEIFVRDYFRKRVPKRYYVAQGHLIDDECRTSPQLDLIISDISNLPSFLSTEDGTEFIPIDSTYIIGEIKSTYRKSEKYIEKFSRTIKKIHTDLNHVEIVNPSYSGVTLDSLVHGLIFEGKHRILNSIFSFIFFVDGGDFDFSDIDSFLASTENKYLPNLIVLLNKGIIIKAKFTDEEIQLTDLPYGPEIIGYEWCFVPIYGEDENTITGNILATLYSSLISHLSKSFLEPPSFEKFISKKIKFDKSKVVRAKPN